MFLHSCAVDRSQLRNHNVLRVCTQLLHRESAYCTSGQVGKLLCLVFNWRRACSPPYELCVPTPLVFSYYSGAILEGSQVGKFSMCIAVAELVVSLLSCFDRFVQLAASRIFISPRIHSICSKRGNLLPV